MSQTRKDPLVVGEIYHVFTRSIAKFVVLNNTDEFERMYRLISLYRHKGFNIKYSKFVDLTHASQDQITKNLIEENNLLVEIVAYCFMPTHIHLLLKQVSEDGISKFMSKVLNGYSRFFNAKHKRTGPLWSGRFKNVLVTTDEQLLHLTRYLHLNPTSADIAKKPDDWEFSSYGEYINTIDPQFRICNFRDIIDISAKEYKKFVDDRKKYQRELSLIKSLIIDNYTG